MNSLPPNKPESVLDRNQLLARLYGIMQALPDTLFEVNQDNEILFAHTQPGEFRLDPNKSLEWNFPEKASHTIKEAVSEVLSTGKKTTVMYELPPDNVGEPTKIYLANLGKTSRNTVVIISRNVTTEIVDRKKLQEANEALTQFASLASHDLREPLIGIAGFATLLQKKYQNKLDRRGNHFLDQIIKVAQQMEKKLDGLLAFSRVDKGENFGPFPIGAAVEEAKRSLVKKISESKAKIEINGILPEAYGDRGMLAQVLQNLFSNSIKYRRKNETPVIEVEVTNHNDLFWRISVRDNGIGFDVKHQDKIFKIFHRLYTIEQYPGTGVGLAIAKRVVERHGGEIWTESVIGEGTTFYFTLPKVQ